MRRFEENYKPVEVELVDRHGHAVRLKSRLMTLEDNKQMEEEIRDNKNNEITNSEISMIQMARIFGGSPKDYGKYSVDILMDVLMYYTDQKTNPTKATPTT